MWLEPTSSEECICRMADWIEIASVEECPPGTSLERAVSGQMVALANADGQYYAMDGLCPHQGGPLGKGVLCGTILTCPWHGWQFNVVDGKHQLSSTVGQSTYQVNVQDGKIFIRFNDDRKSES